MPLQIHHDGNGQVYVEWEQRPPNGPSTGGFKRAWIRRPDPGSDRDWAGTGKYINVAAIAGFGQGPGATHEKL